MSVEIGSRKALERAASGDASALLHAFSWRGTQQGEPYWGARYTGIEPLSEADKEYLQSLLDNASENDAPQAQSEVPETGGERSVAFAVTLEETEQYMRQLHDVLYNAAIGDEGMKTSTAIVIGECLTFLRKMIFQLKKELA